jgi:6-phosphogluconolactonase (cycloisomerase 2 family)
MPAMRWAHLGAAALGLLVLALGACSGGDDAPPPSEPKYFAYVADTLDDNITAFEIDPETGVPTQARTRSLPANMQAHSLAVTPSGRNAYAVGHYLSALYGYAIDPDTGAWNGVPGSPFLAGVLPTSLTVDPLGRFIFVAGYYYGGVAVCQIKGTGELLPVPGSPFAVLGGPSRIAAEPTGRFIYVLCADSATVAAFRIHETGALIPVGGPVAAGSDPRSLMVDPAGRRLYVVKPGTRDISAFAIDPSTGELTPVFNSPFAIPQPAPFTLVPQAMAIDPTGRGAVVACLGSMALASFWIDDATGSLIWNGTVVTTWDYPVALGFGPTGRHIYVIHDSAPGKLSFYRVDPAAGTIGLEDALPLGRLPAALVLSRLTR